MNHMIKCKFVTNRETIFRCRLFVEIKLKLAAAKQRIPVVIQLNSGCCCHSSNAFDLVFLRWFDDIIAYFSLVHVKCTK